jgi:group I intron endonuclease
MTPGSLPNFPFFDRSLKSGIYVITCIPLQKKYVGTAANVKPRLLAHKTQLRNGHHFCAAMRADWLQYGESAFTFQFLLIGRGWEEEARRDLEALICSTLPPELRYNAYIDWRRRGGHTNAFYGKSHTLEARQANSAGHLGYKYGKSHTLEARQANSAGHLGYKSGFKGGQQSNEHKKFISEQNKGQSAVERRKAVYIDGNYYESVSQAEALTGYSRRIIRKHCHSKEECRKNFQWASEVDGTKEE